MLYNIPEKRSASQEVEFGRIAFEGRLFRDDEVWFYFYDAGEPSLKYSCLLYTSPHWGADISRAVARI